MVSLLSPKKQMFIWLTIVLLTVAFVGLDLPGKLLQRNTINKYSYIHGAAYWKTACHGVGCELCPRKCFLPEGMKGWCRVRLNMGNKLYTQVYGRAAAVHIDPIEKKPVFHLLPGSKAFSIATAGCNLGCDFCQNWTLSQKHPEQLPADWFPPERVVAEAQRQGCQSIAYTYSEPIIFYEYMLETAKQAKKAGLYNVMISAGYIEPEPLKALLSYMDVVKIDLKGFNQYYYKSVVDGRLEPVLKALQIIDQAGIQLEIVNLVVPGQNDSEEDLRRLVLWIKEKLGPEIPLFFSRFTPHYRMQHVPMTEEASLRRARQIALELGLHYVYTGNLSGGEGEHTFCHNCKELLVQRIGYDVLQNKIKDGKCFNCKTAIPGIWQDSNNSFSMKEQKEE